MAWRGDGRNLLVGHDAISGFRSVRAAIPTRAVTQLHVRVPAAARRYARPNSLPTRSR
jgi:hypothetical protein